MATLPKRPAPSAPAPGRIAGPTTGRAGPMVASPYRIDPTQALRAPGASAPANTGNVLTGGAGGVAPFPASTPVAPPPQARVQASPYRVSSTGGGGSPGTIPGATGYAYGQAVSNPLLRYGVQGNIGGMSSGPRRPGVAGAQHPEWVDASYRPPTPRAPAAGGGGLSAADLLAQDMARANAANEARYQDLLGLNQQGRNEMLADLNASTGALQQQNNANTQSLVGYTQAGAQGLRDQAAAGYGDIFRFLTSGTQRQEQTAGQFSDAEQKLEAQRYGARQGEIRQEMLDRGLRNTTVDQPLLEEAALQNSIRTGLINDRNLDRQLGIQDSYIGRGVNVLGEGTRAGLGAAETGYRLGFDAMAGGQRQGLGIAANYANARQGVLDNSRQERMGVIERRTDEAPDLSLFYSLMSQPQGRVSGGINYGTRSSGPMGVTPAGRGQGVGWNPFDGLNAAGGGVGSVPATVAAAQGGGQQTLRPLPPPPIGTASLGSAAAGYPSPAYQTGSAIGGAAAGAATGGVGRRYDPRLGRYV